MKFHEIDWQYSWMTSALSALDQKLESLAKSVEDGNELGEHVEVLAGLGCVAIQVYIDGTTNDLKQVFQSSCPQKEDLARGESRVIMPAEVSVIQAIGAAANYFKHKGEPKGALGKKRRIVLAALGISKSTPFPCSEVVRQIQGQHWALVPVLRTAREWRQSWFRRLK